MKADATRVQAMTKTGVQNQGMSPKRRCVAKKEEVKEAQGNLAEGRTYVHKSVH